MQVVSLLPHPDTTVARGTRFGGGLCVAYDFKEQLLACELVASSPRVCLGACVFSTMWMRKSVETVIAVAHLSRRRWSQRVRTAVVRSAVESNPRSRVEKLTANVERDMVNHGAPSSRESTTYIS